MGQLINGLKLPKVVFDVIDNIASSYDSDGSDFTPSSLTRPPYMRVLERKHGRQQTQINDSILSVIGTAFHYAAEFHIGEGAEPEHRAFQTVTVDGVDYKVSAQLDLYDTVSKYLFDWKCVGKYTAKKIMAGEAHDYEFQLQLGRWLYEKETGKQVSGLANVIILRESVGFDASLQSVMVKEYDIWSDRLVVQQLTRKIQDQLSERECDDNDRWAKPGRWKVKREGNKTFKWFDTYGEAEKYAIETKGETPTVHTVPGTQLRCEKYCEYRDVCPIKRS